MSISDRLGLRICTLTKNFTSGSDPKSSAFSFHPLAFGQSADDWSSWDDAETIEDRSDIDQILVMINPDTNEAKSFHPYLQPFL